MAEDAIAQLAAELRHYRDVEEITTLKARYCRLVDQQDWNAFAGLLTDDYRLDNGTTAVEGRDAAVAEVARGLTGGSSIHHVHNPEITFTGPDTATAIWPLEDWAHFTIGGKPVTFHGFGHYHEAYARTADGWRIASTVIARLRMDRIDPEAAVPAPARD